MDCSESYGELLIDVEYHKDQDSPEYATHGTEYLLNDRCDGKSIAERTWQSDTATVGSKGRGRGRRENMRRTLEWCDELCRSGWELQVPELS